MLFNKNSYLSYLLQFAAATISHLKYCCMKPISLKNDRRFWALLLLTSILVYTCKNGCTGNNTQTAKKLTSITYTLDCSANPATVNPPGKSTITATLNKIKNYDDNTADTALAADGEIIVFTIDKTDCGPINPAQAKTKNGDASTVFTASGPKAGSGCELKITATFQGKYSCTSNIVVTK